MTIESQIRDFIVDLQQWDGDPAQLTSEASLLDMEVIDSLGIYELVSYIETTYGVTVDDIDVTPANFETLESIRRYVEARSGGPQ